MGCSHSAAGADRTLKTLPNPALNYSRERRVFRSREGVATPVAIRACTAAGAEFVAVLAEVNGRAAQAVPALEMKGKGTLSAGPLTSSRLSDLLEGYLEPQALQ